MKANHYITNLIDRQLSTGNNVEKWGGLPVLACNHIYTEVLKEEKSGEDIVVQSTADKKVAEVITL